MLNSQLQRLIEKIKTQFEKCRPTSVKEIEQSLDKIENLKMVEIIKQNNFQREILILKIEEINFFYDLTCVLIRNEEDQQFYELLQNLEDKENDFRFSEVKVFDFQIGIFLQESNYISLSQLIDEHQVIESTIRIIMIDLVVQFYKLHQQSICLINFGVENIYYSKISNQYRLRFLDCAKKIDQKQFEPIWHHQKEYLPPEIRSLDFSKIKAIKPFLIDSWFLGILILEIFKKVNKDVCSNVTLLLQKYSVTLSGIDYIYINGFYYKNNNDLQWLLEENLANRLTISQFIEKTGCQQLLKLLDLNDQSIEDDMSSLIDLNHTLKKCFINNQTLEIRAIFKNTINLQYLGNTNCQTNNCFNFQSGVLMINQKKVRINQTISIAHEHNIWIINPSLTIKTALHVIYFCISQLKYQIDLSKFIEWVQVENISEYFEKEFPLQITNLELEQQVNSNEIIDLLLAIFSNQNLTRISLRNISHKLIFSVLSKIDLFSLRILDLSTSLIEDEVLETIKFVEKISNLNISNCKMLSQSGLLKFFSTSTFCNLVNLNVSSTKSNDSVFESIWKNKSYQALSALNYNNCSFNNASTISQIIAQINSKQEQIQELSFSNCNVTQQILLALQQITNLRYLDISSNPLINQLHSLKRDNKYQFLNLEHCSITSQDILFLNEFDCLQNCKILISEVKRIYLQKLFSKNRFIFFQNVKVDITELTNFVIEICLVNSEIGNINELLSQSLPNLRLLSLENCCLADKNINNLIHNKNIDNLQSLNLSKNLIHDQSIIQILEKFLHLQQLQLNDTLISEASVMAIQKSTLQSISLKNCKHLTPNDFCQLLITDQLKVKEVNISFNTLNYELQYFLMNNSYRYTLIYDKQFDYQLLRTFCLGRNEEIDVENEYINLSRRVYYGSEKLDGSKQNALEYLLKTRRITRIDLSYTFIQDNTIEMISKWCSEYLKCLMLRGCQSLTHNCIKYLNQLKEIEVIDLMDTFVNENKQESECLSLIYLNTHKSS